MIDALDEILFGAPPIGSPVVIEHLEDRIDRGPEWRACDEDDRYRTGAPLTPSRHDRGLSTEIGRGSDANGNGLSSEKRRRLARMRREQTRGRCRSKAERNLAHWLGEVHRITSALGLPDSLRDRACQLFRSAQDEDLLHGRSIEAVANAYKVVNEDLGLPAEPVTPGPYVPRLASDLDCPDRIRQRARTIAKRAVDAGVTCGVHPAGFAAACLYEAGCEQGRQLPQTAVAEAANVSPTTVRSHRETLENQVI